MSTFPPIITRSDLTEVMSEAESSTDAGKLVMLASHPQMSVRCLVASNLHTPVEALAVLAQDKEGRVRWAVAKNPNTSASTLVVLSQDAMTQVRAIVANREDTPAEVLAKFTESETHEHVITCLVANQKTPLDYVLSKFDIQMYRTWETVINNPGVPVEILVAKYAEGLKTEGMSAELRGGQLLQLKNVLLSVRRREVCEWLTTQMGVPLGDFPDSWICEVLGLK